MPSYEGNDKKMNGKRSNSSGSPENNASKKADYCATTRNITEKLGQTLDSENRKISVWKDKKFVNSDLIPSSRLAERENTKVAIVATVAAGKSTLLNVLCEYPILPASSGTTSCAPTYITRAVTHADEAVTIRPLKRKEINIDGIKRIEFVQDTGNERVLKADSITETFFNDLFEYMMLVMCGNGDEAAAPENVAYFMASPSSADVAFAGTDHDKLATRREEFSLSYQNPRHRLLLLLILLCVYVKQNEKPSHLSSYYAEVNKARKTLIKQYGIPAEGDYSVFLNWCSHSIPEGTTLIDLPGTGSDTQDSEMQSSHTVIVKGILRDADAVWILTSDDGTIEQDLYDTLKDIVESEKTGTGARKNFVCIYNCMNGHINNAKPVREFIEKLPFLVGERCYVMNALAGEYQYLRNGIPAQNTKEASAFRASLYASMGNMFDFEAILRQKYTSVKCPTYVAIRDNSGNIQVKQETACSYSLEEFFQTVLKDYAGRLRYEVALKEILEQVNFYDCITQELHNTLDLIKSVHGKGSDVAKAVEKALDETNGKAMADYMGLLNEVNKEISQELSVLCQTIGTDLEIAFDSDYINLIDRIHREWKTLKQPGHDHELEKNIWGNYPLKSDLPNWKKFTKVRDNVLGYISPAAFTQATQTADNKLNSYFNLLNSYVTKLKKVTDDFRNDYVHAFNSEYDRQKEEICMHDGRVINDALLYNFTKSKKGVRDAIDHSMQTVCEKFSKKFDELVAPNGIFEQVKDAATKEFTKSLSDVILADLRKDICDKYGSTHYVGRFFRFVDHLDVGGLDNLINNSFGDIKNACQVKLKRIVNAIYGGNYDGVKLDGVNLLFRNPIGDGVGEEPPVNFPRELTYSLKTFKSDVEHMLDNDLQLVHNNTQFFIRGTAEGVMDLTPVIAELESAIEDWKKIGNGYVTIGSYLITAGTPLVEKLCSEYLSRISKENG